MAKAPESKKGGKKKLPVIPPRLQTTQRKKFAQRRDKSPDKDIPMEKKLSFRKGDRPSMSPTGRHGKREKLGKITSGGFPRKKSQNQGTHSKWKKGNAGALSMNAIFPQKKGETL